jgi:tRNA A37 methylthiotransferase MiaB
MSDSVPTPVRKWRNRVLREWAAAKNLEFRRRMVGQTLSVVTLEQEGIALSHNYLKVELATSRQPNLIVGVDISGLTAHGLHENRGRSTRATSRIRDAS